MPVDGDWGCDRSAQVYRDPGAHSAGAGRPIGWIVQPRDAMGIGTSRAACRAVGPLRDVYRMPRRRGLGVLGVRGVADRVVTRTFGLGPADADEESDGTCCGRHGDCDARDERQGGASGRRRLCGEDPDAEAPCAGGVHERLGLVVVSKLDPELRDVAGIVDQCAVGTRRRDVVERDQAARSNEGIV